MPRATVIMSSFEPSSAQSSSPELASDFLPTPATDVSFEALGESSTLSYLDGPTGAGNANNGRWILVTGGMGFIGSHTVVDLLKANYNVVIVDDLSNSNGEVLHSIRKIAHDHYENAGRIGQCPRVDFHNLNFRDMPAMRAMLGSYQNAKAATKAPFPSPPSSSPPSSPSRDAVTDYSPSNIVGVIHFAAYKAVDESIRHPVKYYQNNINGLVDFMGLLDDHGIKNFIFSSSATVYGALADGTRVLREENCILHNDSPPAQSPKQDERLLQSGCGDITNPYGRTKYFGEAILADLVASDPSWNIVVLRYFNPVGCDASGMLAEDPKGIPSNLVPVVVQAMMGQRPEIYIYGDDWDTPDGTAVRDFVHVSDIARGHTAALAASLERRVEGSGYRTFNLGTGTGYSVLDVINTMENVSGRNIPRKIVSRRPGDVQSSVAAIDRARSELCWEPKETLVNACQDICNQLRI